MELGRRLFKGRDKAQWKIPLSFDILRFDLRDWLCFIFDFFVDLKSVTFFELGYWALARLR